MPDIVTIEVIFPDPIIASVVIEKIGPAGTQGPQGDPAPALTGEEIAALLDSAIGTSWRESGIGSDPGTVEVVGDGDGTAIADGDGTLLSTTEAAT